MINNTPQAAMTAQQLEAARLLMNEQAAGKHPQEPSVQEGFDTLFKSAADRASAGGANQLAMTSKLTAQAIEIVNFIQQQVAGDFASFKEKVEASIKSHDAMDDLIGEIHNLGEEDVDYLRALTEDELEKMIRSQQSKRSRAKSKYMDKENYHTMMIGAVSELLLRYAIGKPKNSGGGTALGDIGFSEEDLQKLADFPEDLKKAIRNVQSKKSIMKSKADYNPLSERWNQLCIAEQQLKELRDRGSAALNEKATEALKANEEAAKVLESIDVDNIKSPEEFQAYITQLKEMLASK